MIGFRRKAVRFGTESDDSVQFFIAAYVNGMIRCRLNGVARGIL